MYNYSFEFRTGNVVKVKEIAKTNAGMIDTISYACVDNGNVFYHLNKLNIDIREDYLELVDYDDKLPEKVEKKEPKRTVKDVILDMMIQEKLCNIGETAENKYKKEAQNIHENMMKIGIDNSAIDGYCECLEKATIINGTDDFLNKSEEEAAKLFNTSCKGLENLFSKLEHYYIRMAKEKAE